MWFGRPESNAHYIRSIVDRDVFGARLDGSYRGLIALEYHFGVTCNIWWLNGPWSRPGPAATSGWRSRP
jgi:hypothetical protein